MTTVNTRTRWMGTAWILIVALTVAVCVTHADGACAPGRFGGSTCTEEGNPLTLTSVLTDPRTGGQIKITSWTTLTAWNYLVENVSYNPPGGIQNVGMSHFGVNVGAEPRLQTEISDLFNSVGWTYRADGGGGGFVIQGGVGWGSGVAGATSNPEDPGLPLLGLFPGQEALFIFHTAHAFTPRRGRVTCASDAYSHFGATYGSYPMDGDVLFPGYPRRPVFIVPGIAGAFPPTDDPAQALIWLHKRGGNPEALRIDPLAKAYDDLIVTLTNVGYVLGKDLFVVTYDWRLPPGPDDGNIDGMISGIAAPTMTGPPFTYAVDYLGYFLREAANQWATLHPGWYLDAVDVIAHSTGGLVARTYIQSGAYGGVYADGKALPRINNLIMVGVPNRGASKAWNPMHDDWSIEPAFYKVLSKVAWSAYKKVKAGQTIAGTHAIDDAAIGTCPGPWAPEKLCFISQYIPTIRSLLATYPFVDSGNGLEGVNGDPAVRNSLLLDLNVGFDLLQPVDPIPFASQATVTVICASNGGDTPTTVRPRLGPALETTRLPDGSPNVVEVATVANMSDSSPRPAKAQEEWYEDRTTTSRSVSGRAGASGASRTAASSREVSRRYCRSR